MFFFFLGAPEAIDSPELDRLAKVLDLAQLRHPSMTLSMMSTLLRISSTPSHEGDYVSVSDLVENSPGQKYATVARQIELLGDGNRKAPGLGLLEKRPDPNDHRNRHIGISQRGKELLLEFDRVLTPDLMGATSSPSAGSDWGNLE